jgi:hypothetical protein
MAAIQKIENDNSLYQPNKLENQLIKKIAASVGAGALVLSVSANFIKNHASGNDERTMSYIVQPGDTVNGIVQKLEHKYGQDTAGYDYQSEEYRIAQDHPTLHPGDILSVPIK